MTTAQSPLPALQAQADKIATTLKAVARGERVIADRGGKLAAALASDGVTVGIVMDDKIIKVRLLWSTVRSCEEAALSEFIVKTMQGKIGSAA